MSLAFFQRNACAQFYCVVIVPKNFNARGLMKFAGIFSLFALLSATCIADTHFPSPQYLLVGDEDGSQLDNCHFDFSTGYTDVTLYDYELQITAEQRTSDKQLMVVVFPEEEGISFRIHNVQIGKSPQYNLEGLVAKVTGTFIAQVNEGNPIRVQMTVPVQIESVQEFSVSSDEALIQGNQFYKKTLPEMVNKDTQ